MIHFNFYLQHRWEQVCWSGKLFQQIKVKDKKSLVTSLHSTRMHMFVVCATRGYTDVMWLEGHFESFLPAQHMYPHWREISPPPHSKQEASNSETPQLVCTWPYWSKMVSEGNLDRDAHRQSWPVHQAQLAPHRVHNTSRCPLKCSNFF